MAFGVFILGNNSAIPAHGRHPTAQVVQIHEKFFLVDCGEGTQMQIAKYKIKKNRIDHVFISHLHGDHYFGLIGLITSFHLMKRQQPLHIYGPLLLENIIQLQLSSANTTLSFQLVFHETTTSGIQTLFEDENLIIQSFPVQHRIPTTGFLFKEKEFPRNIKVEKKAQLYFPHTVIQQIKSGKDIEWNGELIKSNEWTNPPVPSRAYAYCADTIFHNEITQYIHKCDLLYHEATFMDESAERASVTYHSTAKQAATIAKNADVKKMLIGHFSAKYDNLIPLLNEATEIFPATLLALEGNYFDIEKRINQAI